MTRMAGRFFAVVVTIAFTARAADTEEHKDKEL
jgi:hypothetical protein